MAIYTYSQFRKVLRKLGFACIRELLRQAGIDEGTFRELL